ncbi:NACHT domain-containing NTPase [Mycolicibacterium sp. YH-1]|uniref:NACHT domain-containing protein n=1 Tax=Mycolicibacterium sp. YH-1 TaxID=2908837 RepID=UPI001F4C0898|nr:hypothetical protein [Mycolicibacterium sp. YH-1]UNB52864.1 hypothetical protein L0M16_00280 [Mycolicibacterium sp. YH-1]
MVDANKGAAYTVADLIAMRGTHERRAKRKSELDSTLNKYVAQRFAREDQVLFEQVDLNGPSVDSLFVDVPFACRPDAAIAELMQRIALEAPGDVSSDETSEGYVVTGAAQAVLHPEWRSNALLIGGPGQGKSTLLQYVCQFYRARILRNDLYTGQAQQLRDITAADRVPIRLDLREYAKWASNVPAAAKGDKGSRKKARATQESSWKTIEEYIASEISRDSGGRTFKVEDLGILVSTRSVLLALDGLDEVANLKFREEVSTQIVDTQVRLDVDAVDLVILVATRPGGATSALWSSDKFPKLNLRRLTYGLRLQYLQRWAVVAKLSEQATDKLQRTFLENQHVPHIRELGSYPMQLAILLHLLHRRQLLPQRRTELYSEYVKTFLDREQREDKEPLLAEERQVIEDIHAYIGWFIHTQAEEGKNSGTIRRGELKALLRDHLQGRDDGQALAESLFSAFTTRVLCLVEKDPGSGEFQFDVQSLREYFAAVYIFDEAGRDSRDDCLVALLKRPYWSNVCRFFVGKYSKGEVRGMRAVLQDINSEKLFGLHPMLRSTATLFLNDRTFEGQKDGPIQEVVDFILDGPGVVLAVDGLLDVAGSALEFSDRAGRVQAIRHLKARLECYPQANVQVALIASLRRHATKADGIAEWWWGRFEQTSRWFEIASGLGVLGNLGTNDEERLALLLQQYASGSRWVVELLGAGGYTGSGDGVLGVVKDEINDGAVETIRTVAASSSLGRMLTGARAATTRSEPAPADNAGETSRRRVRNKAKATVLSGIVESMEELRVRPSAATSTTDWQRRLLSVANVWGDGWVLRQAIAAIPEESDLDQIAAITQAKHPVVHAALLTETEAREHRKEASWWREGIDHATVDIEVRHWIFSLLTRATSNVVIELADQLVAVLQPLSAKHFDALQEAIYRFRKTTSSGELVLQDALRMQRIKLSPKALWLLRGIATEASVAWIDKRLAESPDKLLSPGIGDLRELARISAGGKVIKFEKFQGLRASLPSGGWASDTRVGALSSTLAEKVLRQPHDWPGDLVQRAVENVEERMLSAIEPVAVVARHENWFGE